MTVIAARRACAIATAISTHVALAIASSHAPSRVWKSIGASMPFRAVMWPARKNP